MRFSESQIRRELRKLRGWRRRKKEIYRKFLFSSFMPAIRFVNRVARLAEDAFHHPDILINYNRVTLTLTTHDEGGLTERDFNLATKISEIYRRRK